METLSHFLISFSAPCKSLIVPLPNFVRMGSNAQRGEARWDINHLCSRTYEAKKTVVASVYLTLRWSTVTIGSLGVKLTINWA